MYVGINWTSPEAYPVIKKLADYGHIDYCELLIDNFLHLPPDSITSAIGSKPVAFHIMWSRFLERPDQELIEYAEIIRRWIDHLKPIYISDHIAQFTSNGRNLPIVIEVNYGEQKKRIIEKCCRWRDLLKTELYFENFPSVIDTNSGQINFFQTLISENGLEILFDISNAVVSNINCEVELSDWSHCINRTKHFHIAGYRMSDTQPTLAIDSHDTNISEHALEFFKKIIKTRSSDFTIVVERDANIEYNSWLADINNLRREAYETEYSNTLESNKSPVIAN